MNSNSENPVNTGQTAGPAKKKKSGYLVQGSILAIASILVRLIGLVYRIPMANILGIEGNRIYGVAFSIYNIALILSSYSLPLAVSKMVADRAVKKEYKNSYKIFKCALLFAFISGLLMSLIIYFGAGIGEELFQCPGLAKPLQVLAPTIFVVAILGVFRGFYQGKRTMMPTALSQILEQIINGIISVLAAYYLMKAHSASQSIEAYGAAGGTIGTLMGAITALVFLLFVFVVYKPVLRKQIRRDHTRHEETGSQIYTILLLTIVPVILSQLVYQISSPIDSALYGHLIKSEEQSGHLGIYLSQYQLLINVPVAVASAMAASLVPSIVASLARKENDRIKQKVSTSIKFNMVIAFPSAAGLAALAYPIIRLLFPSLIAHSDLAGSMVVYGAVAVIFFILSTMTSAVLQGLNRMRDPVIHSAISLAIHVVLVFVLLKFTGLGIYSLIIGNVTFPLVICIMNWISVKKRLTYKQEVMKTFVIPLVCSVVMGAAAWGSHWLVNTYLHSNLLGVLVAMIVAVIVYFVLILLCKCFNEEEFTELPMGKTLLRAGRKLKLIRSR